jgi:hypothetical protein
MNIIPTDNALRYEPDMEVIDSSMGSKNNKLPIKNNTIQTTEPSNRAIHKISRILTPISVNFFAP